MLEVFKSIFLLGLLLAVVADALQTIIQGGRIISGVFAVAYAAVAAAGCLIVALIIFLVGRGSETTLVRLELTGWLQDAGISTAIGVAFAIVTWVPFQWMQTVAPYLDQGLIILITLFFVPHYVRSLIASGRELLLAAPKPGVRQAIQNVVSDAAAGFGYQDAETWVVATAGKLIVDISLVVEDDTLSMRHMTEVRSDISAAVQRSAAELGADATSWISFESQDSRTE